MKINIFLLHLDYVYSRKVHTRRVFTRPYIIKPGVTPIQLSCYRPPLPTTGGALMEHTGA